VKYYTMGSEIKLTGRHKHSPLLDTHTLDLGQERKVNSRCREVCNRVVYKSEGTNSCKPKQTWTRGCPAVSCDDILKETFCL
jgi:hypothetical protein